LVANINHESDNSIVGRNKNKPDVLISALFYCLVVILPLAVYPGASDQVLSIKYLVLKVITIFLIGLFILKAIDGTKIKVSGLEWPVIALLFFVALATLLSTHPRTSLEGTYLRYDGFYSYLIYIALFFIATQHLSHENRLENFAKLSILAATVVSIYGIAQRFGIDPMPWGYFVFEAERSFSTLGNPILLGGYLSLMLPISLGILLGSKSTDEKIIYSASATVIALCLIMTMSRAAWLGAILALSMVALILIKRRGAGIRIIFTPAAALVTVLSLAIISVGIPDLAGRLTSIFSIGGSMGSRLLMWKSALSMIADRPLFGFGPDALGLAFSKYESIELARIAPLEIQDNVHNAFLQLAATSGIPALLAFLAVISLLFFKTIRNLKEGGVSPLAVGLFGGVIAFITQSVTGVTGIAASTFLWLGMGSLAATWTRDGIEIKPLKGISRYLAVTVVVVVMTASALVSSKTFLSDVALGQAKLAEISGDIEATEALYKKAIEYRTTDSKPHRDLGIMLADVGGSSKNRDMWSQGIAHLSEAVCLSPNDHKSLVLMGQGYLYGARAFNKAYYHDSEEYLKKALEVRPYSSWTRTALGVVYLETGRPDEARDNLLFAIDINPNSPQAHYFAGRYYEESGLKEDALKQYELTLKLDANHKKAKLLYERLVNERNK